MACKTASSSTYTFSTFCSMLGWVKCSCCGELLNHQAKRIEASNPTRYHTEFSCRPALPTIGAETTCVAGLHLPILSAAHS